MYTELYSLLFLFRRGFSVDESWESDSELDEDDDDEESLKSLLSSLLL